MALSATARGKLVSFLALAVPVLAGLGYLALAGAPPANLAVNAAALLLAGIWIAVGKAPSTVRNRRIAIGVLLVLLALPLVTGPFANGIARWIPLGPLAVHSGMLVIPPLIVLAMRESNYTAPILLAAVFIALLQPDAATGFAITFAAVGMHDRTKDWKLGLVVVIGFVASLIMAVRGELPAKPFVERVLVEAAGIHPAIAIGLFAALVTSFVIMLFAIPGDRPTRFALGGSLFGLTVISLMENYPSALIGYGAAPILGFGLAIGMLQSRIEDRYRGDT